MDNDLLSQDAVTVAPLLLGWQLIAHSPNGDTGGVIVETEAYRASDDAASHAYRRLPTPRTAPMFMASGTIYIYFTYGMHYCLNLVTGPADSAQAVLIRALEPTIGINLMRSRRNTTTPDYRLASGPANLCRVLGLNSTLSGSQLGGVLELRPPEQSLNYQVLAGPRIGIKLATNLDWRFWFDGHRSVSKLP